MVSFIDEHRDRWPVAVMCRTVPRESKPGNSGAGSRRPNASNQSGLGPDRTRMPCALHTGIDSGTSYPYADSGVITVGAGKQR